jgi:hypothetical protein
MGTQINAKVQPADSAFTRQGYRAVVSGEAMNPTRSKPRP